MISLRQSRFTDILPENLASQVEVQALAYAVGNQIAQLVPQADGVRVYAAVDTMDHAVLDYLAVELRIEGYRQSQSLDVKRRLVKQAMAVTAKLGTAGAVRQTTRPSTTMLRCRSGLSMAVSRTISACSWAASGPAWRKSTSSPSPLSG